MKTLILVIVVAGCAYEIGLQRGQELERIQIAQQQTAVAATQKPTPTPGAWMWNSANKLNATPIAKGGKH